MWKSLKPGEQVQPGDIVRHISSLSRSAFGEHTYEVVKADLHYFEIAEKPEQVNTKEPERRIIRYSDIGYHLVLEIWDQLMNSGEGFKTGYV
jgi:hypothetical protein